ncbi:hypothetical protein SAMN05216454_10228 [Peptostreptococcus russellii]|uniref:Uncharacterized protein n=1 Tax=Peptostreptococcus russellii TaxID=215200 RepID=A0A1H8F7N2_9FIRM|nr:hypothetical protein SAMN05216454_10228 [Peptostreptococcus russellii]
MVIMSYDIYLLFKQLESVFVIEGRYKYAEKCGHNDIFLG